MQSQNFCEGLRNEKSLLVRRTALTFLSKRCSFVNNVLFGMIVDSFLTFGVHYFVSLGKLFFKDEPDEMINLMQQPNQCCLFYHIQN